MNHTVIAGVRQIAGRSNSVKQMLIGIACRPAARFVPR
jgi:hypothetical protein